MGGMIHPASAAVAGALLWSTITCLTSAMDRRRGNMKKREEEDDIDADMEKERHRQSIMNQRLFEREVIGNGGW